MLGAPTESTWPGFSALPNASAVRWKAQAHSRLREAFPNASFAGKPQLSHVGFQLLSGLLALDPSQRTGAIDALEHDVGFLHPLPTSQTSPKSPDPPGFSHEHEHNPPSPRPPAPPPSLCAQYFGESPLAVQQSHMTTVSTAPSRVE